MSAAESHERTASTPDEQGRPFTGMALDRASDVRKDRDRVLALLRDPAARVVAAGRDGVLVSGVAGRDGVLVSGVAGLHRAPVDALAIDRDDGLPILLGIDGERGPLFALDLESLDPETRAARQDGARVIGLREAAGELQRAEAGLASYLVALLNWHRAHRFCANCGAPTEITEGGYSRTCGRCQTVHFPRTDPVVIMTVEHDGRLLLGRRAGWPAGRLSVLAGFVSPGESAEEAVVREVREESGVVARAPVFVSSQPWPFPASLMLGFHALADGGEPRPRDRELEEVRWLTRERVIAAAEERDPDLRLPPSISIARFLIDSWLARGG